MLAEAMKQVREIKGIQIEKQEIKLSSFAYCTLLYLKDTKVSTRKLLAWINKRSQIYNQHIKISTLSIDQYNKL